MQCITLNINYHPCFIEMFSLLSLSLYLLVLTSLISSNQVTLKISELKMFSSVNMYCFTVENKIT